MRHYFSTRARELSKKLLATSDTSVNADQSAQISAVVDVIQHDYADVLSSVINEILRAKLRGKPYEVFGNGTVNRGQQEKEPTLRPTTRRMHSVPRLDSGSSPL
jgi:hypothetical protein